MWQTRRVAPRVTARAQAFLSYYPRLTMPPKKSASKDASAATALEAAGDAIDAYELPRALVTRIAKSAVCAAPCLCAYSW
jgi:hypothetical protein